MVAERPKDCNIARERGEALAWGAVFKQTEKAFKWDATTEVFAYLEAVSRCELTKKRLAACEPPEDALEGRLFREPAEARWRRRPDGSYDVWLLREDPLELLSEGGDVLAVERRDRTYYLVGLGTGDDPTVFTEARYLDKRFVYPVSAPTGAQPGLPANKRRAFITVAEYQLLEPTDWDFLALAGEAVITARLDQPLLCAHRFIDVGADWGE